MKNRALQMMQSMASLQVFQSNPFTCKVWGVVKIPKKCLLKECDKLTSHNGGYCCATHCRADRHMRQVREMRDKALKRGAELSKQTRK